MNVVGKSVDVVDDAAGDDVDAAGAMQIPIVGAPSPNFIDLAFLLNSFQRSEVSPKSHGKYPGLIAKRKLRYCFSCSLIVYERPSHYSP
jgi:hypothetical protein